MSCPVASLHFARLLSIIAVFVLGVAVGAEEVEKSDVPLKQVVAYTSGVAFFERVGEVEGDTDLVLRFPDEVMDDLLKSLVLLDLDGGKTAMVTYENRHQLARVEGTLPLVLSSTSSLADVLRQLRGQRITVGDIEGRIVSVESQPRDKGDSAVEEQWLLVQTAEGLLRMSLAAMPMIKLDDPEVHHQFELAIQQMAVTTDTPTKEVTLQFRGEGKRRVRIGYLQEFPMWKVSYRLVIDDDDKEGDQMMLQGWGFVENTTGDDWKDVQLSLVSGQPFAFRMNLYEPLYVARPEAPIAVAAGVLPRPYAGELQAPRSKPGVFGGGGTFGGPMGGGGFGGGVGGSFGPEDRMHENGLGDLLAESQSAMAKTADVGELFHYEMDRPVTLASDTSAMLPIVNARVEGKKVSLYDPAVNEKHPMHAVRLTNSTELHLMRGPITVLDGGGYAGDARLADTPPDAERLITYAMDSQVEVTVATHPSEEKLRNVRLDSGTVIADYRTERKVDYELRNESDKPRLVVLQRLEQVGWEVTAPKVTKTKDQAVRFEAEVPARGATTVVVVEQQDRQAKIPIAQLADDDLKQFIDSPATDAATKETLARFHERQQQALQLRMTINLLEAEIRTLAQEQERIGKAIPQLERGSALYNRYVEKLSEQETQIEQRRKKLDSIKQQHAELLKENDGVSLFDF